jgi:hypothetical protein
LEIVSGFVLRVSCFRHGRQCFGVVVAAQPVKPASQRLQ